MKKMILVLVTAMAINGAVTVVKPDTENVGVQQNKEETTVVKPTMRKVLINAAVAAAIGGVGLGLAAHMGVIAANMDVIDRVMREHKAMLSLDDAQRQERLQELGQNYMQWRDSLFKIDDPIWAFADQCASRAAIIGAAVGGIGALVFQYLD